MILCVRLPDTVVVVCGSVLQCLAACCSVLQCAAVCCRVLQCFTVFCSVLQCVAAGWEPQTILFVRLSDTVCSRCSSVWQSVAVCGSVWYCVAACCSVLQFVAVCYSWVGATGDSVC